jgi:hypothetical protein
MTPKKSGVGGENDIKRAMAKKMKFTITEAARHLGISANAVRKAIKKNRLIRSKP